MKIIAYNTVPICFLILAAFLAYHDKGFWEWCIIFAMALYEEPNKD